MPTPTLRIWLAVAVLAFCAGAARAQAPGNAEFEAGVGAYRSGDYAAALRSFSAAREQGFDGPQLHFNLGLTYYQLRRLGEARAEFEALRRYPDYAGIADFHLALVAAREGDRVQAEGLWRSLERGPDAALAQRAGVALERLAAGQARPAATRYLLAGAGYDSNPALLDESVQPAGGASSDTELFGAFDLPLAGTARAATVLHGGAYLKNYSDDNGADQRGWFAGLSREGDDGKRWGSWGLEASTSALDGEPFLRIVGVQAQRGPAAGSPGSRVRVQLSRIGASEQYAHLEGWRLRLGAGRAAQAGRGLVRVGYEFEANDRDDLAEGGEFFSHSPLRHRLELVVEHPGGERTSLRWNLRYRDSRYRDRDRFLQGGTLREERRVETLAQAGLQLRRALGREVFVLLEYQHSRNAATPEVYDYDRNTALVGLEWTPRGK